MSKTPAAPPPGDKPVRTAPPPPPAWRHWLWIGWLVVILLYVVTSFVHTTQPSELSYSQFIGNVSAHKVKTVDIPSPSSAGANVTLTGTLANGKQFQAVTPPVTPGSTVSNELQANHVAISYQSGGSSGWSELLYFLL